MREPVWAFSLDYLFSFVIQFSIAIKHLIETRDHNDYLCNHDALLFWNKKSEQVYQ